MTSRATDRRWDVVVIGGGGLQAKAMFEAAARGGLIGRWLACDRAWRPERTDALERLGATCTTLDVLDDAEGLRELTSQAGVVMNFAGPYYRTGGTVLDACIETGTGYLDICDDSDATLSLLERDDAATAAGVPALIGMGSSPGTTNVLVRAAVDALGSADEVTLSWVVDVADMTGAAALHFFHIFALIDPDGTRHGVPAWEDLERRTVDFPEPVGRQTVVELAHPEPITLPRFLPVGAAANFGGVVPTDVLAASWALARLGAADDSTLPVRGSDVPIGELAGALYTRYHQTRRPTPYVGSGLVVDVRRGDETLRFSSGSTTSMEESTGTPAAAGLALMLDRKTPERGVFAPECLDPAAFFPALGSVSQQRGSLKLDRIAAGREPERLRLRELFAGSSTA